MTIFDQNCPQRAGCAACPASGVRSQVGPSCRHGRRGHIYHHHLITRVLPPPQGLSLQTTACRCQAAALRASSDKPPYAQKSIRFAQELARAGALLVQPALSSGSQEVSWAFRTYTGLYIQETAQTKPFLTPHASCEFLSGCRWVKAGRRPGSAGLTPASRGWTGTSHPAPSSQRRSSKLPLLLFLLLPFCGNVFYSF